MTLVEPADARPQPAVAPSSPSPRAVAGRRIRGILAYRATWAVVLLLVAVWLIEKALIGQVRDGRAIGYLSMGALPNADIVGKGSPDQWWRFISSALQHDRRNPLHLAVNVFALLMVGPVIERLYGRLVMLSALATGVLAGGISWLAASEIGFDAMPDYTIGCSAGICALLGIMLVHGYRKRAALGHHESRALRAQAALGIALMVLIGLVVPNLNNVAHAGGLASGVALALLLPMPTGRRPTLGVLGRASLSGVLALAALSMTIAVANVVARLMTLHS